MSWVKADRRGPVAHERERAAQERELNSFRAGVSITFQETLTLTLQAHPRTSEVRVVKNEKIHRRLGLGLRVTG